MNEKFDIYLEFLQGYNEKVNLVSSTDPETVRIKHFEDSLAIKKLQDYIDLDSELDMVDVGSGGGFPGLPIAIEYPKLKLLAVDSIGKKLSFIELLAAKLGILNRVSTAKARAEELGRDPEKREKFDLAITRAVAKMSIVSEYCLPLVKVGGYFVAYKAKNIYEELDEANIAIKELGGEVVATVKYSLSGCEQRALVLIKKIKPTPAKYPRKPGIAAKRPIH